MLKEQMKTKIREMIRDYTDACRDCVEHPSKVHYRIYSMKLELLLNEIDELLEELYGGK